ncbi:unnamed protein product [Leptidea sinapis]|uniref:Uncharacterized protein n=1 Tax=Leptidea sinapis TaxID=189913 RepID=A0A5E4QCN4_9NEOP|nr:unnamed protein product [Leptidea sinapis]
MLTVISPPLAAGVNNVAAGGPLANNTGAGAPGGLNTGAGAPGGHNTAGGAPGGHNTAGGAPGGKPASAQLTTHAASATDLATEESKLNRQTQQHATDLHKSSSDSVVASDRLQASPGPPRPHPARISTQPINIPGSPQRTSAPADAADIDVLLSASMTMHACKKAAKKSDMRVSCEAIPEEMSGTSPQPLPLVQKSEQQNKQHPHLLTYNSDPGELLLASCMSTCGPQTSSDSTVVRDELPPLARSKRSNTISVMSPTDRTRSSSGGVAPSFVFLQLYHNMSTYPISPPVPGNI